MGVHNQIIDNFLSPIRTNLVERLESYEHDYEEKQREHTHKYAVVAGYIIFLLSYSITAILSRNDESIYFVQSNLKKLLVTGHNYNRFNKDGSSPYVSLDEVHTVGDIYGWLTTTFHDTIYTAETFDGDTRLDKPAGGPNYHYGSYRTSVGRRGFVAGHNMLLGGIRVSQVRGREKECDLPERLLSGYIAESDLERDRRFLCYDSSLNGKNTTSFANNTFLCDADYDYNDPPLDGCSVEFLGPYEYHRIDFEKKENLLLNLMDYSYPSPGFYMVLPHSNATLAKQIYATMFDSGFIDLQTRAIFIDGSFWNSNLGTIITVRISFSLPVEGSVFTQIESNVADIYRCTPLNMRLCNPGDFLRLLFELICFVAVFSYICFVLVRTSLYVYKIASWHYGLNLRAQGNRDIRSFAPLLNEHVHKKSTVRFADSLDEEKGLKDILPRDKKLKHKTKSLVGLEKMRHKSLLKKIFAFLKHETDGFWFWNAFLLLQFSLFLSFFGAKFVAIHIAPSNFNIASNDFIDFRKSTLWFVKADSLNSLFIFFSWLRLFEVLTFFTQHSITWFCCMLLTFIVGSSLSHQVAFGAYSESYRTFGNSFFTTLNSLRGSIPFNELSLIIDDRSLGVLFAMTYVVILVFIFIHMILAIIYVIGNVVQNRVQIDLEYKLEERRDEYRKRARIYSVDNFTSNDYWGSDSSAKEEEDDLSLNSEDDLILDRRRRLRRAKRRAKRKAFMTSVRDYVETDPILGKDRPPSPAASDASVGDIVEMDANGDVDRHFSFFNPPPVKCFGTAFCVGNEGKKKMLKNKNSDSATSCSNNRENNRDNSSGSGREVMKPSLRNSLAVGELTPEHQHISVEDHLKYLEGVLPDGAYGIAQKAAVALKMFGFETPNQIADKLLNVIDVPTAYREVYAEQRNSSYTLSNADITAASSPGPGRESIRSNLARIMCENTRFFVDVCKEICFASNVASGAVENAISDVLLSVDEATGQVNIASIYNLCESIGLPLNNRSKAAIQCIFAFPFASSDERFSVTSLTKAGLEVIDPHVYMESFPLVVFAASILTTKSRIIIPVIFSSFLSKPTIIGRVKDLSVHLKETLSSRDNSFSANLDNLLDKIYLFSELLLRPSFEDEWREKGREVIFRLNETNFSTKIVQDFGQVLGPLKRYSNKLRDLIKSDKVDQFDAIYAQHSFEIDIQRELTDLGQSFGVMSLHDLRSKLSDVMLFCPHNSTLYISVSPPLKRYSSRDSGLKEVDNFLKTVMSEES